MLASNALRRIAEPAAVVAAIVAALGIHGVLRAGLALMAAESAASPSKEQIAGRVSTAPGLTFDLTVWLFVMIVGLLLTAYFWNRVPLSRPADARPARGQRWTLRRSRPEPARRPAAHQRPAAGATGATETDSKAGGAAPEPRPLAGSGQTIDASGPHHSANRQPFASLEAVATPSTRPMAARLAASPRATVVAATPRREHRPFSHVQLLFNTATAILLGIAGSAGIVFMVLAGSQLVAAAL
ncbi:MAG: hypothetical protein AB8G96_06890 [Phycisphaerales bacterium]